jgi:hypothetical protein
MEGSVSCAFMAARLKQVGRDLKRVRRAAAMAVLRDKVIPAAEAGFARGSTLGRKIWGYTNKRGTWRSAFTRGRKHTQKSLGLITSHAGGFHHVTESYHSKAGALEKYTRDLMRDTTASRRVQKKLGASNNYPLIVRTGKTRWMGDNLHVTLHARGIAAHLEEGIPFKAHLHGRSRAAGRIRNEFTGRYESNPDRPMHPGGRVRKRAAMEPALRVHASDLGRDVKAAVENFMAEAL